MKPISFVLVVFVMVRSIACLGQTEIPKIWKHSMKLESSYQGGMTQYSYKLVINDSVSYMDVISEKGPKHYERRFTQQELDDLLAFLTKNNFHKIESEDTGPTSDKASESVILQWDSNVIGASESDSVSIIDAYSDNFNTILEYVKALFGKKNK